MTTPTAQAVTQLPDITLSAPNPWVTAIIVTHNGQPWLSRLLAALPHQTRPPDDIIVVDTGSTDPSVELCRKAFGVDSVHLAPAKTGFGAAIRFGLTQPARVDLTQPQGVQWLWLLHDDCDPSPDALAELLHAGSSSSAVAVVGPKILDWDDPTKLREVGLTVGRTGRKSTGLSGPERDQGQHDHRTDVLAVSSAAMLIRRQVWDDLAGFDPALPMLRDDIDFCWRVHLAGHRVILAPQATVADAQATSTNQRTPAAISPNIALVDRRHALQVALSRAGWATPLLLGWLILVGLGRSLALVFSSPRTAVTELGALTLVLATPWRWIRSSWRTKQHTTLSKSQVGQLLTPRFAGLRQLAEIAGGWAAGEHPAHLPTPETGPTSDEAESLPTPSAARTGRVLRHPLTWALATLIAATGWAWRTTWTDLFRTGPLGGGELRTTDATPDQLWRTATTGIPTLTGTEPASPLYQLQAGWTWLGGALTGNNTPGLATDLLLLLAPILAALSAYHCARVSTPSRWLRTWAALLWGGSPLLGAMVSQGRIGPLLATICIPVVAASLTLTLRTHGPRHAPFAAALSTALLTTAVPALGALALAVGLLGLIWQRRLVVAGYLLLSLGLLGPWALHLVQNPVSLLAGPGALAPAEPQVDLRWGMSIPGSWRSVLDLSGWPAWLVLAQVLGLAALATVAMARGGQRGRLVLGLGVLALVGLGYAVAATRLELSDRGPSPLTPWPGVGFALAQFAVLAALVVAADTIPGQLAAHGFGWRQILLTPALVLAILSPILGGLGWALGGQLGLRDSASWALPAVTAAAAETGVATLVISPDRGHWRYRLATDIPGPVARDLPVRTAQDSPLAAVAQALSAPARSAPVPADVTEQLARLKIGWVLLRPNDPAIAQTLDQIPSLARAGRPPGGQLWRVGAASELPPAAPAAPPNPWLWWTRAQWALLILTFGAAIPLRRTRGATS